MCYSHYGNGVRNGAISIAQWGLLSDCYNVNPIGQRGKILVIVMGFVDTLGQCNQDFPPLASGVYFIVIINKSQWDARIMY
jgi:hypothetical protein